ncbi:MAG: amino acid transporter [Blastocatellia bacterium]|nr:amino acid transporter [Blastocatellia bacterium]
MNPTLPSGEGGASTLAHGTHESSRVFGGTPETGLYRFGFGIRNWLMSGASQSPEQTISHHGHQHPTQPWWKVMCLTGVDYFSTLGYQPGIAFLAAGALAPIATVVLVLLTLFGALPIYQRVAEASPNGQGSIAMLESLLTRWKGKAFVLVLLGFAATDFVITMTLSAADATAHIVENPYAPHWLEAHPVLVTAVLLLFLGAIFMKGFKEAIGLAVFLVIVYLALNALVIGRSLYEIAVHPDYLANWRYALMSGEQHGSPWLILGAALLVFPKLALGLSGFETGVAVMPLVRGGPLDTPKNPEGRIHNSKKLLRTAALIMSVALIGSSFATALLIPPAEFQSGGQAYGRALSFLCHGFFGDFIGTAYDISTISILWFAGASAMAGLLNLIPRYLPRYGMAPEWARAVRPLVLVLTSVTLLVTWIFEANVEAQGGAYATGVLVLMTSAAFAVTLLLWRRGGWHRIAFLLITLVFVYTTIDNVHERPDGVKIALVFIATIVLSSFISRVVRSTELRVTKVILDDAARKFIDETGTGTVRIVANRPDRGLEEEYRKKEQDARQDHHIPPGEPIIILEVRPGDASEFTDELEVTGVRVGPYRILRCESPAIPNAIAALLMHIRDTTDKLPHVYFGWTEGNPIAYVLKFIAFGEGDTAPVTREVLRQAIDEPELRPRVHVG